MISKALPMFWNKPGDQDNKHQDNKNDDPWRRKNKETGPPDLDQILRNFTRKMKNMFGSNNSPRSSSAGNEEFKFMGGLLLIVVFVVYIISGIYIVDPPERAVITRFGQYARTVGPGPHWLPTFIEAKQIQNVEQVATTDHSGLMLTKDGNIVSVSVAVQYRIGDNEDDVRAFLFNVMNPVRSLHQSTESALRQVVGQFTMDEVLTLKREEIADAIKNQTIATIKNYDTGIWVLDVVMQYAKPPDEVRAAFDEVIKATADEERLVNQARAYENEVLPRARGTAERLKNEAMGYKQETILIAEGNVQRFNLVLPQYTKAPKVMQTRMYLDALENILSKTTKVMVDSGQGNNLIYLPLDKILTEKISGAEAEYSASEMGNAPSNAPAVSASNPKEIIPPIFKGQKEKNQ